MAQELVLRQIYYSPRHGYRSTENLYKQANAQLSQLDPPEHVTRHQVKLFLEAQVAYQKNKKYKHPRHFLHTWVSDLGEQLQVDLVFMRAYAKENDNYEYIFVAIELLSRQAFAFPQMNKFGTTSVRSFETLLDHFHARFHTFPKKIQFDDGSEFLNKDVAKYLDEKNITYFTANSKRKATVVERLNRTLKEKLVKIFEHRGNHMWVDVLHDVVSNYNSQVNRSIGLEPKNVNQDNKWIAWGRLFAHVAEGTQPKYKIGDKVRIANFKESFAGANFRRYFREKYGERTRNARGEIVFKRHVDLQAKKSPFTDEIFEIKKVLLGDPTVYKLYSPEADINILGKFYEDELSLVRP